MYSIILAGGSGSRLWPLSRRKFPKQFLKLTDDETLLQKTVKRNLFFSEKEDIVIVTNQDHSFFVKSQVQTKLGEKVNVLDEPVGKNTAPAIALGIKYIQEKLHGKLNDPVFISPSDHIISPASEFADYVKTAEKFAKNGYIVTFGVVPTKPETGYGYINKGEKIDENCYKVKQFVEKPDLETAKKYLESGNYLWNSGMFMFSIETFIEEIEKYEPKIYDIFTSSFEDMIENFHKMPEISIDYAIMEKSNKVVVIPINITWSDIGSWDSVYEVMPKDENKNVIQGNVVSKNSKNSLIIGSKRLLCTVGVEDLIIADTDDAILIAKKGYSQQVKDIVELLRKEEREEAEVHKTVYRPWGSYTVLDEGVNYKVKKIVVNPGQKLSLQLHYHRAEHWIGLKGTAKVQIGDEFIYLHENEKAYIPKATKHRIENPGKIHFEMIEVQIGEYVGEDDIVRFEDIYGRVK
ncbi:mannose-1-phosphate guanylyltransferase/mannose-6-phosphate isomerase [Deferribacter autotrophicus]|uniref:mannose-1-phosphate guanylyltransferase n=1 Tax=Deferribacter autotrophicus TaxID=500465 RepID=A0A5A8F029_9BACT|nr:mannose-1-phosphate guanylyltransferase/mannose-6-phosphate isomerase [Deferribacter autotrophicus]KAA0257326.1 mannose-1-phosphate guanylyltransferase/mannose-6-phosphate isomerase [Deferribacter autotrophicus]